MKTSKLIPAVACIGVLIPVVLFARTVEPLLRDCRRQAIEEYHTALIDSQRQYHDEVEQAMEERKQGYVESWNQEDDGDVRQMQRDADKRYSERTSDARKAKRDQDRLSGKTYSDSKRRCSDEASSRSSASRDSSRSASLSSRSSSSRTSSSRSSSSSRTSSSRSSSYSSYRPNGCAGNDQMCPTGSHCQCVIVDCGEATPYCIPGCNWKCIFPNPPPPHCNDIACPDGRHFPTCTPGGAVINYFQYPCNT